MFELVRRGSSAAVIESKPQAFRRLCVIGCASSGIGNPLQYLCRLRPLLLCAILLGAIAIGKAQSGGATGTIVGTVVDSTGAVIAGAEVIITEADTGVTTSGLSQ